MKLRLSISTFLCSARPWILLAVAASAFPASAQVSFSIDYRGPTIAVPGPVPITEGDLLVPATLAPAYGPLPPPMIAISGGMGPPAPGLGLPMHPAAIGHPPGVPGLVELDAHSFGMDARVLPAPMLAGTYVFSVDEFAVGIGGLPLAPSVRTEALALEASADVFEDLGLPPPPLAPPPPGFLTPGNSGAVDGDGVVSASGGKYVGTGLKEPRPPMPGGGPAPGDNLDALDVDTPLAPGMFLPTYFSLDPSFLDPIRGVLNTGSAMANGFLPAQILLTAAPGGPPVVYAMPAQLGLDLLGTGRDDLDALALWENGVAGFQPGGPFAWLGAAPTDMCLFSVRRGSSIVGVPDALFGAPIEPGDILCPPPVAGMPPSIFIAAEWLGLATARSGLVNIGDELDALDTVAPPQTGLPYCFGDGSSGVCPCLPVPNWGSPGFGCANSLFATGARLAASGAASVAGDTVLLSGTSMPNSSCIYFQGTLQQVVPLQDGLLCVGGNAIRLGQKVNVGFASSYPGSADPAVSVRGAIPAAGATRFYQVFYRNAAPLFCPPGTANYTNAVAIVWTP
ncbi:MAG: hypothetical protein HZA53_06775 [Planctomycetes bacterium]|nr:hypothetical protein [Planctomycetota bacterium]